MIKYIQPGIRFFRLLVKFPTFQNLKNINFLRKRVKKCFTCFFMIVSHVLRFFILYAFSCLNTLIINFYEYFRSPVYNSEEEDSAQSSSDEDFPAPEPQEVAEERLLFLSIIFSSIAILYSSVYPHICKLCML